MMHRLFLLLLAFLSLVGPVSFANEAEEVAASEEPMTLSRVDSILMELAEGQQIPGDLMDRKKFWQRKLGEFIRSPKYADLRERYFQAMRQYQVNGKYLSRMSYNSILRKLSRANKRLPWLAYRLMSDVENAKAYSIKSEVKTSGRTVDEALWEKHLDGKIAELATEAGRISAIPEKPRRAYLDIYLSETGKSLRENQKRLEAKYTNPARIAKEHAKFIYALKETADFKAVSAYLAHEALTHAPLKDQLRSGAADVIFDSLDSIKNNPAVLAKRLGPDSAEFVNLMRERFPETHRIKQNKKMFPQDKVKGKTGVEMAAAKSSVDSSTEFVPTPRLFHALWKGDCYRECVSTALERFLTPVLTDTAFHFVEIDGKNAGWTQMIPGNRDGSGDTYASVDFGAHALTNKATAKDPQGNLYQTTVFELWLQQVMNDLPKGWKGLLVGHSYAGDNANVLSTVRGSAPFLTGKPLMHGRDFTPLDQNVRAIGSIRWIPLVMVYYSRDLLYDAKIPGVGELILLNAVPASVMESVQALRGFLEGAGSRYQFNEMAKEIKRRKVRPDIWRKTIEQVANESIHEIARSYAIEQIHEAMLPKERTAEILANALKSRNRHVAQAAARAILSRDPTHFEATQITMDLFRRSTLHQVLNPEDTELLLDVLNRATKLPASQIQDLKEFVLQPNPNRFNAKTRNRVVELLAKHIPGDSDLVSWLSRQVAARKGEARIDAILDLSSMKGASPEAFKALQKARGDRHPGVQMAATFASLDLGDTSPATVRAVQDLASHPDFWVRRDAIKRLIPLGAVDPSVRNLVLSKTTDSHPAVASLAQEAEQQWASSKPGGCDPGLEKIARVDEAR